MTILHEERLSDSPYVEKIMYGQMVAEGSSIRPAETSWHMVFSKHDGRIHPLLVGPLTTAGVASWGEGGEVLWIKFKLGTFMPHLPFKQLLDGETLLPEASSQSFWLKSSSWQFPDYENADTFIDRLVRDEVLVFDPVVNAMLQEQPQDLSSRSVRHHFLRATGMTRMHIHQVERAQRAADLLRQGLSILDTVDEAGYFDQPHLTRSLKQWVGYTPAQIIRMSKPDCDSAQDGELAAEYNAMAVAAL